MALTGSTIASTYLKLLRANSDTMGADATASYIQDSADTDSALSISTTRVGIGTAGPAYNLHVAGSATQTVSIHSSAGDSILRLDSDSDEGQDSVLKFESGGGASKGSITYDHNATDSGQSMKFVVGDGATTVAVLDMNSRISLSNNDSGTDNTVFGFLAGAAGLSGGTDNVLIGDYAGNALTSADYNISIGADAMLVHTTGGYNIAIGGTAMDDTNAGSTSLGSIHNIFIGYSSGGGTWTDAASNYNVAVGNYSMEGALDGALSNTALGYNSGAGLTQGDENVLIGKSAGSSLTTGASNVAIGANAGDALTTSNNSVAIGLNALGAGTTQSHNNVAIGHTAMSGNFSTAAVEGCVAVGQGSMLGVLTATASNTTAIGKDSLVALTSGAGNIAIGYQALLQHTSGARNMAIGYQAMVDTGGEPTSTDNVMIGYQAGSGNWGTATSNWNVGIGNYVMDGDLAGANYNTAVGHGALTALTEGDNNTAIGYQAGYALTEAGNCILIGNAAGKAVDEGHQSLAIGSQSLEFETGATGTVAIGSYSSRQQALGSGASGNTAIGYSASTNNETGTNNTAIGYQSMVGASDENHSDNTGIGFQALYSIGDDCSSNTCIGSGAGSNISVSGGVAGSENVCIGKAAGDAINAGKGNICIGDGADVDTGARNGSIAIGQDRLTDNGDNTCAIGDNAYVTVISFNSGSQSWTSTSDERIKKDVVDTDLGLDFVNKLRPIKFKDVPPAEWPEAIRPTKLKPSHYISPNKLNDGFIAQEVIQVAKDLGVIFSGCGTGDEPDSQKQMLQYHKFIMPLVKAVQELSAKVKALEDAQ